MSVSLNVDPLAEQTMRTYAYVNNNPIMLVDAMGMAVKGWRIDKDTKEKNNQEGKTSGGFGTGFNIGQSNTRRLW